MPGIKFCTKIMSEGIHPSKRCLALQRLLANGTASSAERSCTWRRQDVVFDMPTSTSKSCNDVWSDIQPFGLRKALVDEDDQLPDSFHAVHIHCPEHKTWNARHQQPDQRPSTETIKANLIELASGI